MVPCECAWQRSSATGIQIVNKLLSQQKWQPQPCGSLEYNGLLMGLKSQTTDCNQNFNWKFFVPSLTYRLLLSHSLMSHFICLYLFLSSPALFHHTQTHSHCIVCPSRPGLLKDLKTMGSISLFIFFITLLVLARQVGPNCKSLNDGGSLLFHQHHQCDLLFFHPVVSILLHTVLHLLESKLCKVQQWTILQIFCSLLQKNWSSSHEDSWVLFAAQPL